jgi:hypothetical protein
MWVLRYTYLWIGKDLSRFGLLVSYWRENCSRLGSFDH